MLKLKVGSAEDGRLLAIAFDEPLDDFITVLSVEVVKDKAAALAWFAEVSVTQPWIDRS